MLPEFQIIKLISIVKISIDTIYTRRRVFFKLHFDEVPSDNESHLKRLTDKMTDCVVQKRPGLERTGMQVIVGAKFHK